MYTMYIWNTFNIIQIIFDLFHSSAWAYHLPLFELYEILRNSLNFWVIELKVKKVSWHQAPIKVQSSIIKVLLRLNIWYLKRKFWLIKSIMSWKFMADKMSLHSSSELMLTEIIGWLADFELREPDSCLEFCFQGIFLRKNNFLPFCLGYLDDNLWMFIFIKPFIKAY